MRERFRFRPKKRTTFFLRRQQYYFTIESNWNGKTIVHSEKYHNRKDRDDIMDALKAELQYANIFDEIDYDINGY